MAPGSSESKAALYEDQTFWLVETASGRSAAGSIDACSNHALPPIVTVRIRRPSNARRTTHAVMDRLEIEVGALFVVVAVMYPSVYRIPVWARWSPLRPCTAPKRGVTHARAGLAAEAMAGESGELLSANENIDARGRKFDCVASAVKSERAEQHFSTDVACPARNCSCAEHGPLEISAPCGRTRGWRPAAGRAQ